MKFMEPSVKQRSSSSIPRSRQGDGVRALVKKKKSEEGKKRLIDFMANSIIYSFLFIISFVLIVPTLRAESDVVQMDNYWLQRAEEAKKAALDAYVEDPFNVTQYFNTEVDEGLVAETSSSRRSLLRKRRGKCEATNPIDRCWRCDPNWAKNRQKLVDCVLGFGRKTTGGKYGPIYVVTDPLDDDVVNPKPGTLRHAVIQNGRLWIIFKQHMVIKLKEELLVTSHKTIDARGAFVTISGGAGITLQFVQNVIIHGLRIHGIVKKNGGIIADSVGHAGFRTKSDGDGITLFGASNIWIDHVSMRNCSDGLIDAIMGSTGITISNSHFTDHNDVMLFGAKDEHTQDRIMQVTVAFNRFGRGCVQRMPRARWGFFHVVNNDYTHWLMYAIGGSAQPTIVSQGNRFRAPNNQNSKEICHREKANEEEWKKWNWISQNDVLKNGARFTTSGDQKFIKKFSRQDMITAKHGRSVKRMTRYTGSLDCFEGKPC